MKRIIFLRHLPHIWDNGKYMIDHRDYRKLKSLGQTLNIDVIIHSSKMRDYITALALDQGCKSKMLVRDERLRNKEFLKPTQFLKEIQQNTDNNGLDTIAIIAGQTVLELLGSLPLEHGTFHIKNFHTKQDCLTCGSIEDFQKIWPNDYKYPKEIIDYLY